MDGLAARAFVFREHDPMVSRADLIHLVGDMDDARLAQILALEPSVAEIEEAVLWIDGEADELAKSGRALTGKAAAIFEILAADLEEEPPPPAT